MTSPLPLVLTAPLSPNVALLLGSRIPARLAWSGNGGLPRVVPIWFHWAGERLVMATFAGSRKLAEIVDGSVVAVTIDTDTFPYRHLKMRGPVTLEPVDGLADDYRIAAERYLGSELAESWCNNLAGAEQVVIGLRPTWAVESDMSSMDFMSGR